MTSYGVFNGHKTMADPASCGAIPADVRERPLKVTVRSTEWHLLYCLVQNQVLQKAFPLIIMSLKTIVQVKWCTVKSIQNMGWVTAYWTALQCEGLAVLVYDWTTTSSRSNSLHTTLISDHTITQTHTEKQHWKIMPHSLRSPGSWNFLKLYSWLLLRENKCKKKKYLNK